MTPSHIRSLLNSVLLVSISTIYCSCNDDGCKSSSDCKSGFICREGKCVPAEDDTETDSNDIESDNGSEKDRSSDHRESDSKDQPTDDMSSESESSTEDAGTTDDSESSESCRAVGLNGEACDQDCDCVSDHCGDGICCDEGECCATTADCVNDLCRAAACRVNHVCEYAPEAFACGEEDELGTQTCSGANACNGKGDCLPVKNACAPYSVDPSGAYSCLDNSIVASCYASCTSFNASINCAPNASCIDDICAVSDADLLLNGEPCTHNNQCLSDHCDNKICCSEGDCCLTEDDCSDECRTSACDLDFSCRTTILRPCGAEDTYGSKTCMADHRCDGQGNCLALITSCSPYVGDESYQCIAGASVTESCRTNCTYPAHCADNFTCDEDGVCIIEDSLSNGEACTEDSQCISGHCQNGFCCESGNCCATADDCGDLCGTMSCVDAHCVVESPIVCGGEDRTGEDVCTNNARCDGAGGCLTLTTCDDAYKAVSGQFTCEAEISVSQTCQSTCNSSTVCNPGFRCDTDSGECVAIEYAENGATCSVDGDCRSGHCGNGYCCVEGDCCGDADDCLVGRCVYEICSSGACDASNLVPCGLPDTDGTFSNCTGGALCDGHGGCIAEITRCTGPYAWNGEYHCTVGEVEETCHTSCDSAIECNVGYGCVGGVCIEQLENGEGPCSADAGCLSNHCNTNTGICCDKGMCCSDNADCGGNACDALTHSCDISCNLDTGDDDDICRVFGEYHCDDGLCESNLLNGEYLCDEASDCVSTHCDTRIFGICCADDTAPCCVSSNQCDDALVCIDNQCVTDCSPKGTRDHTLCNEGHHCEGSVCVADINLGAVGCSSSIECGVGNKCENNVCCTDSDGECCRSDDSCDDENPCTDDVCLPSYHCVHIPLRAGVVCDEDGEFCSGLDTCDENGVCQKSDPPCAEMDACQIDASCDEETDTCIFGDPNPNAVGNTCSSALFCLNGREKVCDSQGHCVDPMPEAGSPCDLESDDMCKSSTCDESTHSCVVNSLPNGTPCNDSDPCTGENICQDGACVPGPNPPCEDDNPCTEDTCAVVDNQIVCGSHTPIDGEPCNEGFACVGSSSMCGDGYCIPAEDVCEDDMGICTISGCIDQHFGKVNCGERTQNTLTVLDCGTSVAIDNRSIFSTREYYAYNSSCSGSYPGMEAPVAIRMTSDGPVTLTVSKVTPPMDIGMAVLGDWCNPTTCRQVGINTITFDGTAGLNVVVLEAMDTLPPTDLTLTAGACP